MADEINLEACKSVLADLEKASGADIWLDRAVSVALDQPWDWSVNWRGWGYDESGKPIEQEKAFPYTSSLDATIALVERVLPGWWWIAGICGLTGHASIGPDYNGPHRERLLREFPIEKFDAGFDVDLAPGDGIHRACYALLTAMFRALVAKMEGVE